MLRLSSPHLHGGLSHELPQEDGSLEACFSERSDEGSSAVPDGQTDTQGNWLPEVELVTACCSERLPLEDAHGRTHQAQIGADCLRPSADECAARAQHVRSMNAQTTEKNLHQENHIFQNYVKYVAPLRFFFRVGCAAIQG